MNVLFCLLKCLSGMDFINKLAVKYRSNPVAKILFAPLWHLYMPYNLKREIDFSTVWYGITVEGKESFRFRGLLFLAGFWNIIGCL